MDPVPGTPSDQPPSISPPPVQPPAAAIPVAQPVREPLKLLPGIPFPPFVIVFAIVTSAAFFLGIFRLPGAISTEIKYEKGLHLMEENKTQKAVENLKAVVDKYPDAEDAKIDLAKAYAMNGDIRESALILQTFEGKQVSKDQSTKLDEVAGLLNSKLPPEKNEGDVK